MISPNKVVIISNTENAIIIQMTVAWGRGCTDPWLCATNRNMVVLVR